MVYRGLGMVQKGPFLGSKNHGLQLIGNTHKVIRVMGAFFELWTLQKVFPVMATYRLG